MREILFRGKTLLDKWIEGDLLQYLGDGKVHIVQHYKGAGGQEVIPETVGQYTGLTDITGKKIFEGDIVIYTDAEADYEGYHDNVFLNRGEVGVSAWDGIYFTNRQTVEMSDLYRGETMVDCKVIGNIHDNPELVKEVCL